MGLARDRARMARALGESPWLSPSLLWTPMKRTCMTRSLVVPSWLATKRENHVKMNERERELQIFESKKLVKGGRREERGCGGSPYGRFGYVAFSH